MNSSVRWNPAPAGVAVDRPVTGPTGELRRGPGGGLLLLDVLLVFGGDTIALRQIRLMKTELMSPPGYGRAHGGAPGGASSSRAYDRLPCPGTSRSYARDDRYRSGAGRRSPTPSGAADDDRSSAFESVDFDRDDSFRSVLGLIRSFHGMEEPAGVPSARCKTSLASAYGLMSEVSPAFTLPASPLVRSLLDDANLALSKFLEDQTVHGFLPVPGRRHRRYYRTSSSSFPGPYTVQPGVTAITLEKVSEAKKRSVALSASQVSSMETNAFWGM